jgi:hypothetical protein
MAIRYFIEQAPDRFYEQSELRTVKARARRLSDRREGGVYIIAEEYMPEARDYAQIGHIAFYSGVQDGTEGRVQ